MADNDALNGRDFIALKRLTDGQGRPIAEVGETCERVQAAKSGGTVSEALARLLASGKIARTRRKTGRP